MPQEVLCTEERVPLINDLTDEGVVTSLFPREAPGIPQHHAGQQEGRGPGGGR